jgi:simple sugar transport system ATP-binding protein
VGQSALSGAGAPVPVAEAIGIGKRLGATIALQNVGIRVLPGESHALVGRNGAGKSTLVGVLTGMRLHDTGSVAFNGVPAPPPGDRAAWQRCVACVYQHSTIIPALSVAENLFVNRQPGRGGVIDWRAMRREARALLDRWQVDVPEDARARDLGVEQRQLVEIARALSYGARFIILDEPTAQLDGAAIGRLFARMRELQRAGVTFLFISHHLQEVYEICQAVTVLRDGRHIVSAPVADLPKQRLIEAMTGETGGLNVPDAVHRPPVESAPVLQVDGLAGPDFADIGFTVRRGEVVGLAGATSSGCMTVAETVAGLRAPRAGTVRVDGRTLRPGDVPDALAHGIGCVPRDRHREGLVLGRSVGDNATLTLGDALGPAGVVMPGRQRAFAARMIKSLGIVTQGPEQPVARLSGGNQQKVVLARAMATDPAVLVLINPTAGVDVKSKESLLASVERERARGKAVLLCSAEIDDLRICDRVLVMFRGGIVAVYPAGWTDADLIAEMEGLAHAA